MKKKKYNLSEYKNLIRLINEHITANNISINFIAKTFGIKYQHLIRILRMEHKTTDVNILDIFDFILKIEKNNFTEKSSNDNFHYKNKCIEKTLYLLSILNEIENYEDFFIEIFYLVHDEKLKKFDFCIDYLVKNKIIRITENKMMKDINFHTVNLPKRSSILLINNSIRYFENKNNFEKAYQLSLSNKNCKKREMFFMEYINELNSKNKFNDIHTAFYNYFSWLKKNNMRKSKILKLFYLSVMIIITNLENHLAKEYIYSIYLSKNTSLMKNIFSTEYDHNFNFEAIYAIDEKIESKYNAFSFYFNTALLRIYDLYIKLQMHKLAAAFNQFLLTKMKPDDYYYPYFFSQNQHMLFYYGNIKDILNYIDSLKKLKSDSKYTKLFFFKYLYSIFTDGKKQKNLMANQFVKDFNKSNYHFSYINNLFEANLTSEIIDYNYLLALGLAISFSFYKNNSNINESFLYILIILLQTIKNKKFRNLNLTLNDIYQLLQENPFYEIFEIPEKNIFYKKLFSVFLNINKSKINQNKNMDIIDFFIICLPSIKKYFNTLKEKYVKAQQNLTKNKDKILKSMKNKLIEDGYLKKNSKKNPDIVSIFINRYPEDNEILKLFHQESSKEDILRNFIFIQEYNFLIYFMNQMIKDFLQFESINIRNKQIANDPVALLSRNMIKRIMKSNFDFHTYITNYFENYLLELEQKRKEIQMGIDSTEQGESINMTEQLMSLFNNDVNDRFLRFTKAYILAKY